MSSNGPSPIVYIIPAVLLVAVVAYYVYGAIDRLGLDTQQGEARVTGKQFATGSTTYNTNVVAGRTFVQSSQNPDLYVIALDVNGEAAGGAVTKELFESLQQGDVVHIEFQRTRVSRQLLVTDVRR